jgi:hypothetical protein
MQIRSSLTNLGSIAAVLVLAGACAQDLPTVAEAPGFPELPAFAPPPRCSGQINFVITMAEGPAGTQAIRGDDVSNSYQEGVAGVAAHAASANGNLMLSVLNAPTRRYSWTASAASGLSNDRLYTNSHTNPGGDSGCGLAGMAAPSTGSAVFEAELLAGAGNLDIIRYGKDCSGSAVSGTRVTTTLSADGNTWTISGTSGVYCTKLSGKKLTQSGTTGPFSMTLVRN